MQSQDQAMSPQRRMVLFAIVHDPEGNNIEASLSSGSEWRGRGGLRRSARVCRPQPRLHRLWHRQQP